MVRRMIARLREKRWARAILRDMETPAGIDRYMPERLTLRSKRGG